MLLLEDPSILMLPVKRTAGASARPDMSGVAVSESDR